MSGRCRGLRVAAVAVVLAGVAGCTSEPREPEATEPQTSQAPQDDCPGGVVITELGSDAATGFRAMSIQLSNCGADAYTVDGYPVVQVLDEESSVADIEITHGENSIEDPGPQAIELAPGDSVVSVLSWRNTVEAGDPVNGVALDVAPAEGEPAQRFETEYPVDLGTTGTLDVTAWHLG